MLFNQVLKTYFKNGRKGKTSGMSNKNIPMSTIFYDTYPAMVPYEQRVYMNLNSSKKIEYGIIYDDSVVALAERKFGETFPVVK